MTEYFVTGGTYKDLEGEERFDLLCPGSEKLPYILVDGTMNCFRLVRQNAHLYRVMDDYTLSLVVLSHEALEFGIKAPQRVKLDADLLKKIQAVIKQGTLKESP